MRRAARSLSERPERGWQTPHKFAPARRRSAKGATFQIERHLTHPKQQRARRRMSGGAGPSLERGGVCSTHPHGGRLWRATAGEQVGRLALQRRLVAARTPWASPVTARIGGSGETQLKSRRAFAAKIRFAMFPVATPAGFPVKQFGHGGKRITGARATTTPDGTRTAQDAWVRIPGKHDAWGLLIAARHARSGL
jgi:hypothetical protein